MGPPSLPLDARRCKRASQVLTLLAEIQRLNAEAAEAAQQRDCISAERDAAVANVRRLRRKNHAAAGEKELLTVALDDVIQGVYHDRRAARANAESSKCEVRCAPKLTRQSGTCCLTAYAAQSAQSHGLDLLSLLSLLSARR